MKISKRVSKFLLLVFLSIQIFRVETAQGRGSLNSKVKQKLKRESAGHYNFQYGEMPSDFYHKQKPQPSASRSLALPKGTKLTLTPQITIPILDAADTNGIGSSFQASIPVTIQLNDVKWSLLGHELFDLEGWKYGRRSFFNAKNNYNHNDYTPQDSNLYSRNLVYPSEFNATSVTQRRVQRDLTHTVKCPTRNLSDRKMILEKLEMFSSSFGITSSKACLLRAACEIHEIPKHSGLGFFGETVISIFSVQQFQKHCEHDSSLDALSPFVEAEMAGKSGKCHIYKKNCPKSLFTVI